MDKKIFNTAKKALENANIHYEATDGKMLGFSLEGEQANYDVSLLCDEEVGLLLTVVTCHLFVPKEKIDRMCRWIVEANNNIGIGNFAMDTSDGELTFRVSYPVDKGKIDDYMITVLYVNAVRAFENYFVDIVKTIYFEKENGEIDLSEEALEEARRMADTLDDSEE